MTWLHGAPSASAVFPASLVAFVEAATIVLALGCVAILLASIRRAAARISHPPSAPPSPGA